MTDVELEPAGPGAWQILQERIRQVVAEGYDASHDDEHGEGELVDAAVMYCRVAAAQVSERSAYEIAPEARWPWDSASWKPADDPVWNLVRAGALIAAEIDRLLRYAAADRSGVAG